MTEPELLTFLNEQSGDIDVNFQFWLSATFAVLLSFFFAGEKIIGMIKHTLIFLYITSTLLFTTRMGIAGASAERARQELVELGSEMIVVGAGLNSFMGLLYLLILLCGTAATIYIAMNYEKIKIGHGRKL